MTSTIEQNEPESVSGSMLTFTTAIRIRVAFVVSGENRNDHCHHL